MRNLLAGTRIRVQNGTSAFQLDAAGNRTAISPFSTLKASGTLGPTSPPGLPGAPSAPPPPPPPPPSSTTSTTATTAPPPPSTTTTSTTRPPQTTVPPTTTAPPGGPASRVAITSPAAGSTVEGLALVTVSTDSTAGIRRIDLYVDGVREQADYRSPFVFAWLASALPAGSHTLSATLVRTNGTSIRSATVTVRTTGR